jgi:hypothetical protein
MPSYMVSSVHRTRRSIASAFHAIERNARKNTTMMVSAAYQSGNYGDPWYNENLQQGEPFLHEIFRDLWRIIFTPSPPVANRIHRSFDRIGLMPGEFATAHIRALYAIKDRPLEHTKELARKVHSSLRPIL